MANFKKHTSCPFCSSSDAFAIYDDNSGYCFSCKESRGSDNFKNNKKEKKMGNPTNLIQGEYTPLAARKISLATAKKYKYQTGMYNGKPCHIANYYNKDGEKVGQKLRFADKTFKTLGKVKGDLLFGSQIWRDKGRQVILCEGELDALSVAEAYGAKYPVVSLPAGAGSALKAVKANLEFLEGFDSILLWMDNDKEGNKAVDEIAGIFKVGKVKIVKHSEHKDASDVLVNEGKQAVVATTYEAKDWRPDGILKGSDMWEEFKNKPVFETFDYKYPIIQDKLKGIRKGELTTFTAGSGLGKSTVVREIAYDLMMTQDAKIGYIALEENWRTTLSKFLGLYAKKPIFFGDELTDKEEKEAWDATIGQSKLFLYDHFGSMEIDNLLAKIRVMVQTCGVDFVILDHISIVVSGMDGNMDERKAIDKLMTDLRSLTEQTGVGMVIISHLRRTGGNKGHEDGEQISLGQLRGSGAIAQLSDTVVGIERNAQAEGNESDQISMRVLKNRFAGGLGLADTLQYNHTTGCLDLMSGDFYTRPEPKEEPEPEVYKKMSIDDKEDLPW
ncbi:DNA primase/helicase [Lauvirus lau218]|uniref:DNA helicase/primase n=1 Tax=Lauvirus lau218 TaxID=1465639 RepID=A0A060BH36_9CAUD|nr:DNA primase/helicase [Lauvirus lau218]